MPHDRLFNRSVPSEYRPSTEKGDPLVDGFSAEAKANCHHVRTSVHRLYLFALSIKMIGLIVILVLVLIAVWMAITVQQRQDAFERRIALERKGEDWSPKMDS